MTNKNPQLSPKVVAGKASQNAMEKILQGNVKQVPKWRFVVKNIVLWFVGGLCVVAGALTVSLIIFTLANSALFTHHIPRINFLRHLMVVLPILWVSITILFIVFFDILVRRTKQGYRYSLSILMIINIVLSVLMGVIFYSCGISHVVDDLLGRFRHYHSVESRQAQIFDAPDKGVVVGRVMGCDDEYFTLVTPRGRGWYVMYENVSGFKAGDIIDGQVLMVVGKKINDNIFAACDIHSRGMRGGNSQVRNRHMKRIQKVQGDKVQICTCEKISDNVRQMVQTACTQVQ